MHVHTQNQYKKIKCIPCILLFFCLFYNNCLIVCLELMNWDYTYKSRSKLHLLQSLPVVEQFPPEGRVASWTVSWLLDLFDFSLLNRDRDCSPHLKTSLFIYTSPEQLTPVIITPSWVPSQMAWCQSHWTWHYDPMWSLSLQGVI